LRKDRQTDRLADRNGLINSKKENPTLIHFISHCVILFIQWFMD